MDQLNESSSFVRAAFVAEVNMGQDLGEDEEVMG